MIERAEEGGDEKGEEEGREGHGGDYVIARAVFVRPKQSHVIEEIASSATLRLRSLSLAPLSAGLLATT